MLNEYMSTKEAADFLGYDTAYIRYLCIHKKLPGAEKFNNDWAIPEKSVREYIPGLQGFAAVKARKDAEMNNWIKLARKTAAQHKRNSAMSDKQS